MITQSLLNQEFSNFFDFENRGDITIVKVKILRASLKVSLKFKEFSTNLVYGNRKKIIVDMTYCDFMDSSFLGAIVNLVKISRSAGGEVKLVMKHHIQQYISKITRMDRILTIYEELDTALKSFTENAKND